MTSEGTITPPRRAISYDTEFLEDGRTIDLISIGMVDDAGRELYLINADAPWGRIAERPWLVDNVLPSLPRAEVTPSNPAGINFEHLLVVPRATIALEVRDFILGEHPDVAPVDAGRPVDLWAWYGAFDHVALAWLFGPMIDLPQGIPMFTNDIRQWVGMLGDPPLPRQSAGAHNALEDARFNVVRRCLLAEYAAGRLTLDKLAEIAAAPMADVAVLTRPRGAVSPGDPDWVEGFGPVPGSGLPE